VTDGLDMCLAPKARLILVRQRTDSPWRTWGIPQESGRYVNEALKARLQSRDDSQSRIYCTSKLMALTAEVIRAFSAGAFWIR